MYEYRYSDYEECPSIDEAMRFVLIAMAVGSLHTLAGSPVSSSPSLDNKATHMYALNTGSLTARAGDRIGDLSGFISRAFSRGWGLRARTLLWAVAQVWGRVSYESQRRSVSSDRILGIVAPRCTGILEMIRDPIKFACDGLRGKLLSIYRGSVPMLPREPSTGCVSESLASSVRCFGTQGWKAVRKVLALLLVVVREMGVHDSYTTPANKEVSLVLDVGDSPAWMVACAGCARRGSVIVQIRSLDIETSGASKDNAIVYYSLS